MKTIELNNSKKVITAEPYRPAMHSDFIGRTHESRMLTAAWMGRDGQPPLCPLLVGEPGVGKNRLVYELARRSGLDLYIFQGHEDVTAEDIACTVRFSDEPGRSMDYVLSPLVTAMRRGGICFIDEIGKIRPRALALLASVLDERRYIDSTLLGERIHAHPMFRFVAATNTGETHGLPDFVRSRLRPVVDVGFPSKEEINLMLSRVGGKEPDMEELLQVFWDLFATINRAPSARDALHLFALAASLRTVGPAEPVSPAAGSESTREPALFVQSIPMSGKHIEEAFNQLFKKESQ